MTRVEPVLDGEHASAFPSHAAARRTRYRYVDFAARAQPGFRNHVVTVDEVASLVERWGAEDCYASVFRFPSDVLLYAAEHRVGGRPSVAGYDGPIWAPFLPLDIDAHPPAFGLKEALVLARRTQDLLVDRWQVPAAALHVYFSGAKGFHVLIDMRAAGGVRPARDLHRLFVHLRLAILAELPNAARSLLDLVIGDKMRLLRLPNTRHSGSGLFKVALSPEELDAASAGDVLELARAPRPLTRVTAAGLVPIEIVAAAPALVEHFERARSALGRERGPHPYRFPTPPRSLESAFCPAQLALWRADALPGNRNNAAIRIASALRLSGCAHSKAAEFLREWVARQTHPLPAEEIEGVVHSAYARLYPYRYGCHDQVIRSYCPYAEHREDCAEFLRRHPRSARSS